MTEEENGTINIAAIRFCWTCRMYELKTMFIVSFSSLVTMIHSINGIATLIECAREARI